MLVNIKKELKKLFLSTSTYLFIGLSLLMFSILFYASIHSYGFVNLEHIFNSVGVIVTFTIPLITINIFSEEKKNKNNALFSSPKDTTLLVLSKCIACIIIVLILELLTFIYVGIMMYWGKPHFSTSLLTLFGFLLLSISYISFGIFISSIIKNRLLVTIITLASFLTIMVLPNFYDKLIDYSLIYNFTSTFLSGLLSFKSILILLGCTVFFIFITIFLLQKNKMQKIKINKKLFITIGITFVFFLIYILFNYGVQKLNISSIDITKEKLYTLSDDSKNAIKDVNSSVNIYFFGFSDSESIVVLAKQYNQTNNHINAEVIDIANRQDLVEKYGVQNEDLGIIIEGLNAYKVLTTQDLYTYDKETNKYLDIGEQKLTNAILDVTMENKSQIYFITGHEEYDINKFGELYTLNIYLQNNINNVTSINLSTTEIPDDCDLLIISSPKQDYDDVEIQSLMNYINNGGNILWLNDSTFLDDMPNLEKILDYYGVQLGKGVVLEQNSSNMINQNPYLILPEINNHEITKEFYGNHSLVFAQATKLQTKDDDTLNNLNITINKILSSSDTSLYFEDLDNINSYEKGPFWLGLESVKKLNDNKSSKLIIYSDNFFVTDSEITIDGNTNLLINVYYNLDFALNSVAYLTNRSEMDVGKKDMGDITIIPNNTQNIVINSIIFIIPLFILICGIVMWIMKLHKFNKTKFI